MRWLSQWFATLCLITCGLALAHSIFWLMVFCVIMGSFAAMWHDDVVSHEAAEKTELRWLNSWMGGIPRERE